MAPTPRSATNCAARLRPRERLVARRRSRSRSARAQAPTSACRARSSSMSAASRWRRTSRRCCRSTCRARRRGRRRPGARAARTPLSERAFPRRALRRGARRRPTPAPTSSCFPRDRHVRHRDAGGAGERPAGRGLSGAGPLDVIGDSGAGVLDEDLRAACLAALDIPREAARARALEFTWAESARQFLGHIAERRAALLSRTA